MRLVVLIGLVNLLWGSTSAQSYSKDSLLEVYNARQMGWVDTLPTSFYVTCGGMGASDANGHFARFVFDQTTSYPSDNSSVYLNRDGLRFTFNFGMGAEFVSRRRVWMHHRIEAQYFHLRGEFGHIVQVGKTAYYTSLREWVMGSFVTDAAILSYKFEPSGRRFYGSLGINAVISNVVLIENIEKTTTDFSGKTVDEFFTKRAGCHPVNYPLSIGGGMIFRTPKLIIKPGLYIMPCLNNSFYYYMASVSIGWRMYQLTSY